MGELDGKVALITGGGTGIGAAIAVAFAHAGAAVAVTGRRAGPLEDTAAGITLAGGTASAHPADVTVAAEMERAVAAVVDRYGRLDVAVANAGAAPPFGAVLDQSEEAWRAIVDLNLTGVWITARVTVPHLVAAGGGTIIVIGSGAGRANFGGLGSYSAAKAGAAALTRVLAAELRPSHIAVNELVPGPVRTPALESLGATAPARGGTSGATGPATGVRLQDEWLKDPEDVARLALYLATLPVDGTTGQCFSMLGRLV